MKRMISIAIVACFFVGIFFMAAPVSAEDEGWIEGTVTTGFIPSVPVAGAKVTVGTSGVTATTDADGYYTFEVGNNITCIY